MYGCKTASKKSLERCFGVTGGPRALSVLGKPAVLVSSNWRNLSMELCFSLQSLPSPFCSHTSFLKACSLPGPLLLLGKHSYFDSKAEKILVFGQRLRPHTPTPSVSLGADGEQDLRSCQHLVSRGSFPKSPVPRVADGVRGALSSPGSASEIRIASISTRGTDSWVLISLLHVSARQPLFLLTELSNCETKERGGLSRASRGRRDLHFHCLVLKLTVLTQERG